MLAVLGAAMAAVWLGGAALSRSSLPDLPKPAPADPVAFTSWALERLRDDHPTWTDEHVAPFKAALERSFASPRREFTPQEYGILYEDFAEFTSMVAEYNPFELCQASAAHLEGLLARAQMLEPMTPEFRAALWAQHQRMRAIFEREARRRYGAWAEEHGVDLDALIAAECRTFDEAFSGHVDHLLFGGAFRMLLTEEQAQEIQAHATDPLSWASAHRERDLLSREGDPTENLRQCVWRLIRHVLWRYRVYTTTVEELRPLWDSLDAYKARRSARGRG